MPAASWLSAALAVACAVLGVRGVLVGGDSLAGGLVCLAAVPLLVVGIVLRQRAGGRRPGPHGRS